MLATPLLEGRIQAAGAASMVWCWTWSFEFAAFNHSHPFFSSQWMLCTLLEEIELRGADRPAGRVEWVRALWPKSQGQPKSPLALGSQDMVGLTL